jgi:cytochrome c peroxidase
MNDERATMNAEGVGGVDRATSRVRGDRLYRRVSGCLAVVALAAAACGAPAAPASVPATPTSVLAAPTSVPETPVATKAPAVVAPSFDLPPAAQKTGFPPVVAPSDNLTTPARVELGRQLFFDPVLSAGNTKSCATCHHPDLGFSNGAAVSPPRPGAPARNVPTLWNAAYNRHLLWDGRSESLEAQAVAPLTLPNEMAATPQEIEAKLRAIPAYVDLFDAAYDGEEQVVTFDYVTRALAAFQRVLLSRNSAFDRFVAGDASALTPQEQRGLALFFSPATACAECHQPPTFAHETFRVVGVPSEDPGRAGVSPTGVRGAFKVPTLRNIALTAPYMHNGSLATLEEVVQFYADGAGRPGGFPSVDPLLKGFDLSEQDKADLVAFLRALTDESELPAVPERTLSGLPTVPRIDSPAR